MIFEDDRTAAQKKTHSVIWMATDSSMSNWGLAKGGPSFAGWACLPKDSRLVEEWIRERPEMGRVRQVPPTYHPPSTPGHCHIYVADEVPPAAQKGKE